MDIYDVYTPNELRKMQGLPPVTVSNSIFERCPNCGANVTSNKCEYCGTILNANLEGVINYEYDRMG